MNKKRLTKALAVVPLAAMFAASADGIVEFREGFERPARGPDGWFITREAGFDHGLGLARTGLGNGWIRNVSGWSGLHRVMMLPYARGLTHCQAEAWIRLSSTVSDGYFTVRRASGDSPGPILNEVKLTGYRVEGYRLYSFPFRYDGEYIFLSVGNWGNGRDSWIQVDDIEISCGRVRT